MKKQELNLFDMQTTETEDTIFTHKFDGKPSRQLENRPFYSIVVACYNSALTLERLLKSIEQQEMNDEIEVILVDDHSTEDYQWIVDRFTDTLCIRQVQTDYNFGPGNSREKGCSIATGEWLCFADHDDRFVPGTLKQIQAEIREHNEQYHVIANFREVADFSFVVLNEMVATRNWCHGKFYNLDNLWRAYDIHFKKDLKTHEDIYVSSVVMCTMVTINGDHPLYSDVFCYEWIANPNSVSRTTYDTDIHFTENFFHDYLTSTGWVAIDMYKEGKICLYFAIEKVFDVMLFCYFYIQRFVYARPTRFKKENIEYTREFYIEAKKVLGFTNFDFVGQIRTNDAEWYNTVRRTAAQGVGPCIETKTFWEFLLILDKEPENKLMMDADAFVHWRDNI